MKYVFVMILGMWVTAAYAGQVQRTTADKLGPYILKARTAQAGSVRASAANNPLNLPPYKIAVLDTGFDRDAAIPGVKLCKTGHWDFASDSPIVAGSFEKHGSIVSSLIANEVKNENYCIMIYQLMNAEGEFPTENVVRALKKAREAGARAVNLSFRSGFYDWDEFRELKKMSEAGIMIFVAAGNESMNLNEACNVFPACYSLENLVTVGALTPDGDTRTSYSNYGSKVKVWLPGEVRTPFGYMRGTSFSTPRALGSYVSRQLHAR